MRFQDTVLSLLLKAVPRGQFARLVQAHGSDRRVRRLDSWSQLVALLTSQIAGCCSLREIEAVLATQKGAAYHLGLGRVCRSTLAVANAKRPVALFEALFACLLARLAERMPAKVGREMIRLVDATSISLNGAVYNWARFSANYAGVKLHAVYDPEADVPTYFTITPVKVGDITEAKKLPLMAGATYVMDRGYYDFGLWAAMDAAGCRFVTRLKDCSPRQVVEERPVVDENILSDQLVQLSKRMKAYRRNPYAKPIRLITVARENGSTLALVTNDLTSPANDIANLYKVRWQNLPPTGSGVELFFKWLKQNLKLESFLGTSLNAVKIQLITALIAYLLLHYAHRLTRAATSRQRFRQLVQATLWQRRALTDLAHLPRPDPPPPPNRQLALALP